MVSKFLLLLFVLLLVAHMNWAASTATFRCRLDAAIDGNCQRCAKLTKSAIVYPMCCYDDEGVYSWCLQYIAYGDHGGIRRGL